MLVLGGIGIVLIAAVTSLLEKIDLRTFARAAWDRATKRAPHPAWGIFRGLLLIAVGITVAFHPAQSMVVLVAVIGSLLFFIGIQGVFTTRCGS
jgi:uncharacterized membrane protein HdeD (DUF308 family)